MSKKKIIIGLILLIVILAIVGGIYYYKTQSKPKLGIYNVDQINLTQLQTDNEKKLLADTKEKLKQNPQDVEAIITLAQLQKWNASFSEAINSLLIADQLQQGNNQILNNLADLYIIEKDFTKAEAVLLVLNSYDSQWINAYNMLYDIYKYNLPEVFKTDKLPNLIKAGQAKDVLKTNESNWYLLLGNYYRDTDNKTEAVVWYEKYLVKDPENKDIQTQIEKLKQ